MTHDDLVRFAAGKLGGKVEITYSGLVVMVDYTMYAITSPELMLKGMGVFMRCGAASVKIYPLQIDVFDYNTNKSATRTLESVADVCEAFWECYVEVEGGQG